MNRKTDTRKRLTLCDWHNEVPVRIQSKGDHYSAKTIAKGILTEEDMANDIGLAPDTVAAVLEWVRDRLRDGYDVELANALHLYVCVERTKMPFIAARTIGAFRKSVADKSVRPYRNEVEISAAKVAAMNRSRKAEFAHVTPETVVRCPQCGTKFKVGKVLG